LSPWRSALATVSGLPPMATAHENAGDAPLLAPPDGAAAACGAPGSGTRVLADRAHPARETVSWCAAHGARAMIPVRTRSSGKPAGSMEWRRHAADSLVPKGMRRRFVRGGDMQSLPPGVRVEAQKVWMGENGHGQRSTAGHMIGAPRKAFGGHVPSRRPGPAAYEIARRAIIHSAGCPCPPQHAPRSRRRGPPPCRSPRRGSNPGRLGKFRVCVSKSVPSHTAPTDRPHDLISPAPRLPAKAARRGGPRGGGNPA